MKVLAVDDNLDALFVLEELLRAENYSVITATNGKDALDIALTELPDLILLDVRMPSLTGIEVLKSLRGHPDGMYIPVILLTAQSEIEEIEVGFSAGANDYICKPYEKDILLARLKAAIKTKEVYTTLKTAQKEEKRLKAELKAIYSLPHIVGKSQSFTSLLSLIEKVQDVNVPVLILGETGTGKELLARSIHFSSPRENNPFIAQNCAAFSETLLESELFGHVKGAFTGALKDKEGIFEAAHLGTLFLDEIGELPMSVQAKLLRVLQDGTFTPVGDTKPKKVDVRILAATHRDIPMMVKQGTFREDLYFRLNVVTVKVPPLRERKADILLLAEHFLALSEKKFGKGKKSFSQDVLRVFSEKTWPGNVRELQNEVERLYLLSGEVLDASLLSNDTISSENMVESSSGSLKEALSNLEKTMMIAALKKSGGNKSEAAKELGISRSNLIAKSQEYGI